MRILHNVLLLAFTHWLRYIRTTYFIATLIVKSNLFCDVIISFKGFHNIATYLYTNLHVKGVKFITLTKLASSHQPTICHIKLPPVASIFFLCQGKLVLCFRKGLFKLPKGNASMVASMPTPILALSGPPY